MPALVALALGFLCFVVFRYFRLRNHRMRHTEAEGDGRTPPSPSPPPQLAVVPVLAVPLHYGRASNAAHVVQGCRVPATHVVLDPSSGSGLSTQSEFPVCVEAGNVCYSAFSRGKKLVERQTSSPYGEDGYYYASGGCDTEELEAPHPCQTVEYGVVEEHLSAPQTDAEAEENKAKEGVV